MVNPISLRTLSRHERPRERLLARGTAALTEVELLAVLLGTGTSERDVIEVAHNLLATFHGLRGLLAAAPSRLLAVAGIGPARAATILACLELAERCAHGSRPGEVVASPDVTRAYLRARLGRFDREVFACLFLDNQHRLIGYEELFFGTINSATVHPREVVKRLLMLNAAAVIFAHNHPSGVAEPSQADQRITNRLIAACDLVEVRVLDHMVVGSGEIVSFAERGLLN